MSAYLNDQVSTTSRRRYLLISPCRDEAAFLSRTVESVAKQTVLPALWIVVDDGSSDDTPALLRRHAEEFPYIRVLTRENRGFRHVGVGVVEAFNEGLAAVRLEDYDYICKFDMDLELPAGYFAELMTRMEADHRLGGVSGKPYYVDRRTGRLNSEHIGDDHSFGGTKFYRTDCFRDIGGFVRGLCWDVIDGHAARMLGWKVGSSDDPEIRFIHLRPMGSSQVSLWTGRVRFGRAQWFLGTHPLYMLVVAVVRIAYYPFLVGAAGMCWGYWSSCIRRVPRYDRPGFRKYLHRYQLEALVIGKRRAIARAERRGLRNLVASGRSLPS